MRRLMTGVLVGVLTLTGLHAQTITIQPTGTITVNGGTVTVPTGQFSQPSVPGGFGTVAIQVLGTWTGTLAFEGSVSCSTFDTLNATLLGATTPVTSTTGNGQWQASVSGLQCVRVRATAAMTGTASVYIRGGGGGGATSGGSGSGVSATVGSAIGTSVSPIGAEDGSGNARTVKVDGSGNLLVAVTGAGSGGTSSTDGSGYTAGTTAGTPSMGARDDTGTTACAEDKNCIVRVTSSRELMVSAAGAATSAKQDTAQSSLSSIAIEAVTSNAKLDGMITSLDAIVLGTSSLTGTSNLPGIDTAVALTVQGVTGMNPLHIICDSGCQTAALEPSLADNGAFTFGTTLVSPIGGVFDDVASNTVTENSSAAVRMTTNRGLHMNLRSADGAELGVSGSPLVVGDGSGALNVICDSGCAGGTQYAEDSVHSSGDTLTLAGVVQQTADSALAADGDRTLLQVDSNGYLKVNIKAGAGSGGTAMTDDAAFTPASTSITPTGFMFDDVAPDSVNEGDGGIGRMSANRNQYVTIRDAAGNERGLNIAADGSLAITVATIPSHAVTNAGTFAVQADTEITTAAALADNTANPTLGAVAAYNMCYDGSTWDRCISSLLTESTHDGAMTASSTVGTSPMLYAKAAAPTDVTADGDAVLPWALRNGSQVVNIAAGSTLVTATSTSLNVNCTGGCSGGTQYTEDAAETAGATLTMAGAVRRDSAASSSGTDGDNSTLNVDALGRLWVNCGTGCSGGTQYTHDAALTIGSSSTTLSGARASAAVPSDVSADNDAVALWALRSGALAVQPTFGGVLGVANSGNVGTGVQRVVLATDQPAMVGLGIYTEDAGETAGGNLSMVGTVRRDTQASSAGTTGDNATLNTDATGNLWVTGTSIEDAGETAGGTLSMAGSVRRDTLASSAGTTGDNATFNTAADGALYTANVGATNGGGTGSFITSAASTNSTSVKGSAGQIYSLFAINTTATVYYLRLYNSSSAPTCSSATGFVGSIPIPASTTGAGVSIPIPIGWSFGTGIGYCLTGGSSSTDNTNAATGVFGAVVYK